MLMAGIQFTAGEHEFQLFHQQRKGLVQVVRICIAEQASDTGAVGKVMQPVNRDTWCRAGDYRAPGSLAGMIKQAWCSALGVDVGCHATLVHFPAWPAVWLERDDDTGFQQVLERADYLAKEHTKAHCTGERNFGCSRS